MIELNWAKNHTMLIDSTLCKVELDMAKNESTLTFKTDEAEFTVRTPYKERLADEIGSKVKEAKYRDNQAQIVFDRKTFVLFFSPEIYSISELQLGWEVQMVPPAGVNDTGIVEWVGKGFIENDCVYIDPKEIVELAAKRAEETGDNEEWDIDDIFKSRLTRIVRLRLPSGDAFYWHNACFKRSSEMSWNAGMGTFTATPHDLAA